LKAIFGLGNPGKKYLNTRHNIGFRILDNFANKHNLIFEPSKSDFWYLESSFNTFPFFLIKPITFVNNSGLVVNEIIKKFNIELKDILIIYDDINLEFGKIRIRKSGSDGGHNGVKSIIYHLQTINFPRLRYGVSFPKDNETLSNYVLSELSEKEIEIFNNQIIFLIQMVEHFITGSINKMLNFFSNSLNLNAQQ